MDPLGKLRLRLATAILCAFCLCSLADGASIRELWQSIFGSSEGLTGANAGKAGQVSEADLAKIAAHENTRLPRVLDADSRLDSFVAGPESMLTLRVTLLKISNLKSEDGRALNVDRLRAAYRRMFLNAYCSDPQGRRLYTAGVVVVVAISDMRGDLVTKISTTRQDCGLP